MPGEAAHNRFRVIAPRPGDAVPATAPVMRRWLLVEALRASTRTLGGQGGGEGPAPHELAGTHLAYIAHLAFTALSQENPELAGRIAAQAAAAMTDCELLAERLRGDAHQAGINPAEVVRLENTILAGGKGTAVTADTHLCPVRGCRFEVPNDKLLCPADWRLVPARAKKAVNDAWDNGAGEGTDRLVDAQMAAISAVNRIRQAAA